MSRISIEVTPEQHQRLKAIAVLHGKSIKAYVLERTLPPLPEIEAFSEEEALHHLERLLKPRIEALERGDITAKTDTQIFEEVRDESSQ